MVNDILRDGRTLVTEHDLVCYTLLCLGNRGVFEISEDSLLRAGDAVTKRHSGDFEMDIMFSEGEEWQSDELEGYIAIMSNERNALLRAQKENDYSRFAVGGRINERDMAYWIDTCGPAALRRSDRTICSVFGPRKTQRLYRDLDRKTKARMFYEEVASVAFDLDQLKKGEKESVNK